MPSVNVRTVSGRGPTTLTDADYSVGKVVKQDNTKNYKDEMVVAYLLTAAAADVVYAVLGNKAGTIGNGKGNDTLITGGIVAVQIATTFALTDIGKGIGGSTTAGIAEVKDTGGKGAIIGGGTMKVRNPSTGVVSTVNIAYVDLDA